MRALVLGAFLLCCATRGFAADAGNPVIVPSFSEETASAGLDSTYAGGWQYIVGGGVATFDCNGDGFPDMLLAGGEKPAKLYVNHSHRGGALKFEAQVSGLELDKVGGAYPLDIDSDGIMDLVLLRVGEAVVMRGLGACRFERANELWGVDGGNLWWTAFAATWEHGATWPTMALGSYISLSRSIDIDPWGSCTGSLLLRPNSAGTGFDAPAPLRPSYCPLSMLFTDWNRSGTPSLRVSNDREYYRKGSEQLFRLAPGKPPAQYTEADGWRPLKIWGMGIASADVNGDGYPDYFLSSMADNKLQVLSSAPTNGVSKPDFKDVAFDLNTIAQHPYTGDDKRPSTAWHAQFEDVNNDGLVDLFIAKGNISDMLDFAMADPNNLLVQGADGKFVEMGDKAGVASMSQSRGGALADLNLDGLVDLVVVNRNSPAQVWRNTTVRPGHWIEVKLAQDGANRDAVGAWLVVKTAARTIQREITVGGGQASGQAGWWHVGTGADERVQLQVIWPDGSKSELTQVAADSFYTIRKGETPTAWTPG